MTKENSILLTVAGNYYDRTEALINGTVQPEGISLRYLVLPPDEACWRMFSNLAFDVSEGSICGYTIARLQKQPLVAIPVFPYRSFRHSDIFYNVESGIKDPKDLEGKRVGFPVHRNTATVWTRGILQHEFDVNLESVNWFVERKDPIESGYPKKFSIEKVPNSKTVDSMLVSGELDAALWWGALPSFRQHPEKIKRLFQNHKELEKEYYRRTGIFPIMHTLMIKEQIVKEYPWVGLSLLKAFRDAKEICYQKMLETRYSFAWIRDLIEEEEELFRGDPYSYNIRDNIKALETIITYSYEQGLIDRIPTLDELFVDIERL